MQLVSRGQFAPSKTTSSWEQNQVISLENKYLCVLSFLACPGVFNLLLFFLKKKLKQVFPTCVNFCCCVPAGGSSRGGVASGSQSKNIKQKSKARVERPSPQPGPGTSSSGAGPGCSSVWGQWEPFFFSFFFPFKSPRHTATLFSRYLVIKKQQLNIILNLY